MKYHHTPKGQYHKYKNNARTQGAIFALSFDEAMAFWAKPCHYCGGIVVGLGLDRIEPLKGYTKDNIVACCRQCNVMKWSYPQDAFLEQCLKVVKHQGFV